MPTVLIGGGSGLLGSRLSQLLKERDYEVIHLSRKEDLNKPFPRYKWDLKKGLIDPRAVEKADYVINLAGAGIADKRWSDARKRLIIESRVKSTLLLKEAFAERKKLKAFISASAIGYYGDRGTEWLDEKSPAGSGFLAESTSAWENAISQIDTSDFRTVVLRIGIVLSKQGGALPKMLLPLSFGTATYFSSGDQYFSWIHIDDLCRMFIMSIEDDKMKGVYNAVAPNPVTNLQMMKDIVEALEKQAIFLPAPAFALRLGMGEMADVVLSSARVSAEKVLKAGFEFNFPELIPAIQDLEERDI